MRVWKDCPACRQVGIPGKAWKIYPPFLCDFKTKPCPTCRAHFRALDEAIKESTGKRVGVKP